MTQQRVCVINVGSRGEKMGVLQLERERKRSRISKERKGMAIADSLQHFFAWSRGGGEIEKAISYHNTLLITKRTSA